MTIDSANRDTFFMWLNLCKLYEGRNQSEQGPRVMFGWYENSEQHFDCVLVHKARGWVEHFFETHPNNALIVAEIVGVWGKV